MALTIESLTAGVAKEVQLHSLPGVHATIKERRGPGLIDIALSVDESAPLSTGEIRLRYDVEVAGFERVPAQVFEFPRVNGMSFRPAAGVSKIGGTTNLVPGFDYVLVLSGKGLLDVRPRSPFTFGYRFTNVSVLEASDATLRIGMRPPGTGTAKVTPADFKIETPCTDTPVGAGSIDVTVSVPPTPTPTPTPLPPSADLNRPVTIGPGAGLTLRPSPTPTPNRACLDQKARETAQLAADAARCGDTPACVQIRKNEQKAIEDRYQACLSRGGK